MPITIKDIAKETGFSITTVSRALNGYDDVNDKTRNHIVKIATKLGYQPNHVARQLQRRRTNTIGFVMPQRQHNEHDDFFSILLRGITTAAAHRHYDVLISTTDNSGDVLSAYRRIAGEKRADGMIVARTYRDDPRIAYLKSINVPFIVHGRLTPDTQSDFPYIDMDSQLGIAKITRYLIELGHQKIGLILPPKDVAFTPYRLAGYRQVIETIRDFDENYCRNADLTYEGGQQAAIQLLDQDPTLTAIIGCNDWMALGAMNIAKERGYAVGKTFAVVGYDDIPAAAYATPTLTTIRQPIYEIGKDLAEALIEQLNISKPTVEITQRLIEPELVVRDSSGSSPQ